MDEERNTAELTQDQDRGTAKGKKRISKRLIIVLVAAGLFLCVMCGIVATLSRDGESPDATVQETGTLEAPTAILEREPEATLTPQPEPTEAPQATSTPALAVTPDTTPTAIQITEPLVDVPALLDKDAFEIRELLTESLGEPSTDVAPTQDRFGTLSWIIQEQNMMFGFDYLLDGSIDEALIIMGFREYGHTETDVLRAGNLDPDSKEYDLLINPMETENALSIWILVDSPSVPLIGILDGTWQVGIDIEPGTYRTEGTARCYWARVSDFTGSFGAIIANDNPRGPAIVTILESDAGFTSERCGTWVLADEVKPEVPTTSIVDGTWRIGIDMEPGTYRTEGTARCYWARISDFTGTFGAIIANDNPRGPAVVTILESDAGFTSGGCGTWVRQ